MKATVGLLSDRTVLRSKMEGPRPDKFQFVGKEHLYVKTQNRLYAYLLVKQNKIHSARVGRSYKIPKLCVVEYLLDQDRQLGGMHLSNSLAPSLQNTPESSKLMMPKQRTFGCEQKGA